MGCLKMTWVRSASYTGWKKYVGGKVHYLGADRRQAEIKLLLLMLAERGYRPEADTMPVAPSRSLRPLLQEFTAYLPTATVSEVWKEQLRWRAARLRKVLPDTDLGQLDRTPLEGLANVIANAKGSVETRLNDLSCLRLVLGWAVDHDRWAGFPDWRRCLGRKLRRPHKVEVISLDEFVQVYRRASVRLRFHMRLALNTGMIQNEQATLQPAHVLDGGRRISRPRHKTGVWGSWILWDRTAKSLKRYRLSNGDVVLVNAKGGSVVRSIGQAWYKASRSAQVLLPFKAIRKLGACLVRDQAGLAVAQTYLSHRGCTTAEQHYLTPAYPELDQALAAVGRKVESAINSAARTPRRSLAA